MSEHEQLLNCPAPAKLNLFLHVIGRRADGYHLLQSAFQLITLGDTIDFYRNDDGRIHRSHTLADVPEDQDLVVRAAALLQAHCNCNYGVRVHLHKRLPTGAGLGGGSSDAATTLLALNRLWNCGLSRSELMQLGLGLGADVPFFIFGQNAFVEGIGERMQALATPSKWFILIWPDVHVPTPRIFSAQELTRDTKPVRITDFPDAHNASNANNLEWKNDLQAVACAWYPQIQTAIHWLGQFGEARMTGSGSCVFCAFDDENSANEVLKQVPNTWSAWKTQALEQHPLLKWSDEE